MSSDLPASLVNGHPAETLPVSDRGLAYGHGVFETLRIVNGQPQLWQAHLARLQLGAHRLGITLPAGFPDLLLADRQRLCAPLADGVLKIIVTAGSGGRGYAMPETLAAQRIVSLHPAPVYPDSHYREGIRMITCQYRLPINPELAGLKHLNRLDQVLARSEWRDSAIAEGVVCSREGHVIEGTMSNLFAVQGQTLLTPELTLAGVQGVMRDFVMARARALGLAVETVNLPVAAFKESDEVFMTNSVIGICPVRQWDEQLFGKGAVTHRLMADVSRQLRQEAS